MKVDSKTDTTVKISWNAVGYTEGIKEYEVFRNGASIGQRVGTSLSDSGLTAETSYKYQVKAIGANGLESEMSEELLVTTDPAPTEGDG